MNKRDVFGGGLFKVALIGLCALRFASAEEESILQGATVDFRFENFMGATSLVDGNFKSDAHALAHDDSDDRELVIVLPRPLKIVSSFVIA